MKILMAGDVHGNTTHMITLLDNAKAQGCSRVFALGDFGAWEHMEMGRKFFDDVNRHARTRGVDVYFLDGNHDKTSLLVEKYGETKDDEGFLICRPRLKYAPRGHVWVWDGHIFMALGGAYSVDKAWRLAQELYDAERYGVNSSGTLWFPEEQMSDEDLEAYLAAAPVYVDVLLTHDKPRSSNPRWNRKDILECWPNQDRIERAVQRLRPKMLFHAHLHYWYEDLIRHNSGFTEVFGLTSDPHSATEGDRPGTAELSWRVLNLDTEEAMG